MGFFECCHHCTKRYSGCHSVCSDYIEQKKKWEELKAIEHKRREEEALVMCVLKPKYRKGRR